jgi:hypothetical protein
MMINSWSCPWPMILIPNQWVGRRGEGARPSQNRLVVRVGVTGGDG